MEDAGTWGCRASNPAGIDKVDFDLQVFGEYWRLIATLAGVVCTGYLTGDNI